MVNAHCGWCWCCPREGYVVTNSATGAGFYATSVMCNNNFNLTPGVVDTPLEDRHENKEPTVYWQVPDPDYLKTRFWHVPCWVGDCCICRKHSTVQTWKGIFDEITEGLGVYTMGHAPVPEGHTLTLTESHPPIDHWVEGRLAGGWGGSHRVTVRTGHPTNLVEETRHYVVARAQLWGAVPSVDTHILADVQRQRWQYWGIQNPHIHVVGTNHFASVAVGIWAGSHPGGRATLTVGTGYGHGHFEVSDLGGTWSITNGQSRLWNATSDGASELRVRWLGGDLKYGELHLAYNNTAASGFVWRDKILLAAHDVGMWPDFDRDHTIDGNDHALLHAPNAKGIWRHWINDSRNYGYWATNAKEDAPRNSYLGEDTDDDGGETEHNIPKLKDRLRNCEDDVVNGQRDMVNFFPLRIDLPLRQKDVMQSPYTYILKQADGALNFVYTSFTPDNFGDWYTNVCIVGNANGFGPNRYFGATNAPTHHITAQGITLDPQWVRDCDRYQPSFILMCEGRAATTQPLVLEMHNYYGLVFSTELKLSISPVKDMMRYVNVREADAYFTDPHDARKKATAGYWHTNLSEPSNLPDDYLSTNILKKAIVWVHGLDWDESETPAGHAQVFKLLHQSGNNAHYIGVSWTSDQSRRTVGVPGIKTETAPSAYNYDVIGAFVAAHYVKTNLQGTAFIGDNSTIVGHSLGNVLISSLINDHGMKFGNYIMLNPAVPTEAYDGRAPANDPDRRNMTHPHWKPPVSGLIDYSEHVTAAGWSKNFSPSDPRSFVTWDGRFTNVLNQTTVWQFYSGPDNPNDTQGEEILRPASGVVPPLDLRDKEEESITKKEWIWVFYEITKGTVDMPGMGMPNHHTAGWDFSKKYGYGSGIFWQVLPPAAANQLTASDVIGDPFFSQFDDSRHRNISQWRNRSFLRLNPHRWIYRPNNHNEPKDHLPFLPLDTNDPQHMEKMKVHAKLLAEHITPLSSPAGGKALGIGLIGGQKFNLNKAPFKNENLWDSANRPGKSFYQQRDKRWLHGDYKDAPYLLTHPLYREIKKISQGVSQ